MNERQMQFRVGVVVFATMIIGGLLATLSGPLTTSWLPWGRRSYIVGIKVDKAPGVDQNTPVRKNGILIGRVKSIEEQADGMLLKAEINSNRPLYADYEPHIRTTVIGDATIDFEFDFKHKRLAADAQPVPDGYVFNGVADESPFDAIAKFGNLQQDFAEAAHSLNQAGTEVSKLAAKLNETLGDDRKEGKLSHLVETTDRAMKQFETTLTAFNEILGDAPGGVTPTNVARPLNGQPPLNQQPPESARHAAAVERSGYASQASRGPERAARRGARHASHDEPVPRRSPIGREELQKPGGLHRAAGPEGNRHYQRVVKSRQRARSNGDRFQLGDAGAGQSSTARSVNCCTTARRTTTSIP